MIVKVFQSFLQVLQKLFYQILQPSEGIVIKTPRARIWNVLAANFFSRNERNPQVSTNKLGDLKIKLEGISESVRESVRKIPPFFPL